MKNSELIKKSKEEIIQFIEEQRSKIARFKFDLPLKKVKNTAEIKQTKKNIARAFTALKENQK